MTRRVVVTGGAGFVGSHVVDALVRGGDEVAVLDVLHPAAHGAKPSYLSPDAEYVWGDLRDGDLVRRVVRRADAVSHQASMVGLGTNFDDVEDYVANNDLGTATLLRALGGERFSGRLVLASSMVVYGEGRYRCLDHGDVRPGPRSAEDLDHGQFEPRCPRCDGLLTPGPITEDAPLDPRNVYAATKLHQEHLCFCFGRETNASVVALRYHNVYGPRMPRDTLYAGVASIVRSAYKRGEAPEMFEDGAQVRDFVHVRDVARANVAALSAPSEVAGAFNVASGRPRSVLDMATELRRTIGAGVPAPVVSGRYRLGDVRHVFASPERAARELGFRAETTFEEGMMEFATAPLRDPVVSGSGAAPRHDDAGGRDRPDRS